MNALEVLFDNGGGVTIQCAAFAHYYSHDIAHAATDARLLLDGTDPSDWDGNNPDDRIAGDDLPPTGYFVFSGPEVAAQIASGAIESSWANVRAFFGELGCAVED